MIDLSKSSLFSAPFYIRHNQRRLEHLSCLGLDLFEKKVLEPGAGTGDHSMFYLDRGCSVTAFEPRASNCEVYRENLKNAWLENPEKAALFNAPFEAIADLDETFDIVHCYGFLYHVGDPELALTILADRCEDLFLLETCVSMEDNIAVNLLKEPADNPAQAFDGNGCRPTRRWIMQQLLRLFANVYVPRIQPAHDEFPLDWTKPANNKSGLTRSVFIGSRKPLKNGMLLNELPDYQTLF